MDLSCTRDDYDVLYARWLENPGTLLDLAGWEPGMKLLDLCGGTGAVSREALRRGARPSDITLVDLVPRGPAGIRQVAGYAERIGFMLAEEWGQYDVIVCRQAFAYLSLDKINGINLFAACAVLLRPGGQFVFNTFAKPRWAVRPYMYRNRRYVEASAHWGRTVWHLQLCRNHGWDVSRFRWHDERDIYRFARRFTVSREQHGRSVRWVLVRG